jgi:hypothetical protein
MLQGLMEQHQQDQQNEQRPRGRPFPPGTSGNVSGRRRGQDHLVELSATFEAVHRRPPNALEQVSIKACAKLAAAATSPRVNCTDAVRASNTLVKTLRLLGLAGPPRKKVTRRNIPSVDEIIARRSAG